MSQITPVILSGGAGTRLWPLSRTGRPKQLLSLTAACRIRRPANVISGAGRWQSCTC